MTIFHLASIVINIQTVIYGNNVEDLVVENIQD